MFDFHMHSHFSPDASMTMQEAVEASISRGLRVICITDHVDYDFDGNGNDFSISYDEYFQEINRLRLHYSDRIDIRAGVEFGLQPHLYQRYSRDAADWPFDFIISSIHSVAKTDLYSGNYFDLRNQREAYEDYYSEMKDIAENFHSFSVFGHLDVIKRYGGYDIILPFHSYQDMVEEVLKALIKNGKGIELNTSGVRYRVGDYHPSRDIIQMYRKLGGEIITIGSDSHETGHVAFDFKNALEFLQQMGFKYVTTFSQLKPELHPIEKLL